MKKGEIMTENIRNKISKKLMGHTFDEKVKKKISNTLKKKGIRPIAIFDATGNKWNNIRKEKSRITREKVFPPLFIKCRVCNKKFRISPARKFMAKYCSKNCANEGLKIPIEIQKQRRNKKAIIYTHKRNALIRGSSGYFTLTEWQTLKAQYNWTCPACRKAEPKIKLTVDHIIPILKGGSNNIENIQPLCGSCNSKKNTKIIKYDF